MDVSRRGLMAGAAAMAAPLGACTQADALGDLDATALAAAIRSGELDAGDVLEAAIARAEAVNPQLNFLTEKAYDKARAQVAGGLNGPFAGVPTLIKDLLPWTGVATRFGSRAYANHVPTEQPPYMDAILTAGFVPFGKTTTPEFGLTATTEPVLGGATKNPWDVTRSCGGSSGGSGAAVAARVAPIAQASDGGGSIRIPASCNGLFGLKTSRGRGAGSQAEFSVSVNGCLSRSVRDTAAWLAATEMTGDGALLAPVGVVTGPNTQRLRIAVAIPDSRGQDPDADVRAAIEGVAELCTSLGHDVRQSRPPIEDQIFADAFTTLWAASAALDVRDAMAQAPPNTAPEQVLERLTLELAQRAQAAPLGAVEEAISYLLQAEQRYADFFADVDVLLTPVLASVPPPLGTFAPELGLEGFEAVRRYVGYTPLQNAAGAPAMSVPLAWNDAGLPIGAHFAAAQGQERRLLELAYELEEARPWADRRPRLNAG